MKKRWSLPKLPAPDCRGYVMAQDETPVYYETWGSGPAVALADGIGCSGYIWPYVIDGLRSSFRVVRWHYRGHGKTPAPKDRSRLTLQDLADDLAAVLNTLGIEQVHLAGHSMGVQTSLEFYRRYSNRTRSLSLICGASGRLLSSFYGLDVWERLLPVIRRISSGFAPLWKRLLPSPFSYRMALSMEVNPKYISPAVLRPYLVELSKVRPEIFMTMLAYAAMSSADDLLPAIDVPVLVMVGERDHFTPPERGREMAAVIPGARLVMIPEGSHAAPVERPDVVVPELVAFIESAEKNVETPGYPG